MYKINASYRFFIKKFFVILLQLQAFFQCLDFILFAYLNVRISKIFALARGFGGRFSS